MSRYTPHKAGTPSNRSLDSKTVHALNPSRGHFQNSTWYCNCTPALPAEHFRVKKHGRNHGRWFYTCQTSNVDGSKKCSFFLWDEDAKPREEAAVLSNSKSEPAKQSRQSPRSSPGIGTKRTATEARLVDRPDGKRAAAVDDEGFPLSGSDEDDLLALDADPSLEPATPSHRASKAPLGGLPTPSTVTTSTRRQLPWLTSDGPTTTSDAGLLTPTPARHRDALQRPEKAVSPTKSDDAAPQLSNDIFTVLRSNGIQLPPNVASEVSTLLYRNELRIKGLVRGRDITREGLRAREARVAELVARIGALEAQAEVDRAVARKLRFEREGSQTQQ